MNRCIINAVIIVINGIIPTLKCICFIKKANDNKDVDELLMPSLIKNHGIIPAISQKRNGAPSLASPPLSPIENTNQRDNIYAAGCKKAHGNPRYEPKYFF